MLTQKELVKAIDHTILEAETTREDVLRACYEALEHHFASVVVFPTWVALAARRLANTEVKVGTVVGFPFGALTTRAKVYEIRTAIASGAQELQVVINIGALKSGDLTQVRRDLEESLAASHLAGLTREAQETLTQFVLETGYLTDREIFLVSELVREIGGEFLVTSTGFGPPRHVADDVRLIRRNVGATMGIKAAGGIDSAAVAVETLNAGANRLGTGAGTRILQEFLAAEPGQPAGAGRR